MDYSSVEEYERRVKKVLLERSRGKNVDNRMRQLRELAEEGNRLYLSTTRDAVGIRFHVASCYAILGETEKTERLVKDIAARTHGFKNDAEVQVFLKSIGDKEMTEDLFREISADLWAEDENTGNGIVRPLFTAEINYLIDCGDDPFSYIEKGDRRCNYQLAMCYWKIGNHTLAIRCLNTLSDLGNYLLLSEDQIRQLRFEIDNNPNRGYRMGTFEELIDSVYIPEEERRDFDKWVFSEFRR